MQGSTAGSHAYFMSSSRCEQVYFISKNRESLIARLEKKGMGKSTIFGFILSLKSCILDNPNINHLQATQRLHFLGWDDFELDYHTFQLAIACLEEECFESPNY